MIIPINETIKGMYTLLTIVSSSLLITVFICSVSLARASSWDPVLLVNTEAFQIIDDGDGLSDIQLHFGDSLTETLTYDQSNDRFDFSDDLNVSGSLSVSGSLLVNSDLQGDASLQFGNSVATKTLQYSASTNQFVFSDDVYISGDIDSTGIISGAELSIDTLQNCGKIDTDASGSFLCGTDAYAQTLTVAKSGGDFTSVKTAVDSITDASSSKRYLIQVYPGTYTENDITVPDYVSIHGVGNFENTGIVAAVTTGTLLTIGDDTVLSNLTIEGSTGGTCLNINSSESFLYDVELGDCQLGLNIAGSGTLLKATSLVVHNATFSEIVRISNDARAVFIDLYIDATVTTETALNAYGGDTEVQFFNATILASGATNGLLINSGASVNLSSMTTQNAVNGIHIGPNVSTGGTGTWLSGPAGMLMNNSSYDIWIESDAAQVHLPAWRADRDKMLVAQNAVFAISFNDDTPDAESFSVLEELHVGSIERPSRALFGEGDAYSHGMRVFTQNILAVQTDVTTAAQSNTGSNFTFPGVLAGNMIYVGTSRMDNTGSPAKFTGYDMVVGDTPLVAGLGSIIHEYWNGSSWVAFDVMCTHSTQFYRYSNNCFTRPNSEEEIRFNNDIEDSWVANDPVSLGTNYYWIRLRISVAITTAPLFEQFRLHSNQTEISVNGSFGFHGTARERRTFVLSPSTVFYGQGSNTPDNYTFTVGAIGGWTDERVFAAFNGRNFIEEVTGSVTIPRGIDTSNGIRPRIYWKKNQYVSR